MQTSPANREVVPVPPAAPSSDDVVVLPLAAMFIILVDEFIVGFAAASVVGDAASFAIVVDIIAAVVFVIGDVVAWARVHLHKGATSSWRQRFSGELLVE